MTGQHSRRLRVAIIGGGAAGTITACELAAADGDIDVDVVERTGDVGRGLAYSTTDERHVVNVPAGKLSAVAGDPDHLVRWLAVRGEDARPEAFPRRHVYGTYLRELLAAGRASAASTRIAPIHATAVRLRRDDGIRITLEAPDGSSQDRSYDAAVIALGNVDAPPAVALPDDARCFASPWTPGALDVAGLPLDASVLLVGTGLTAVDAALSITDALPRAVVVAASRNGRLPFAHLPGPLRPPAPVDRFPTELASLDELADAWRAHAARSHEAGFDWRAAVDGVRPITQQVWRSLDVSEQARFLAEWRRWWEARRNRAAPSVGERLDELVANGALEVHGGGVRSVRVAQDGIHATVAGAQRRFERVICCTGPTADVMECTNPLLCDLLESGIASPDAHHLGIRTAVDGELVDASGELDPSLFTLGWLRRGELWETLAIPEIREQARTIAARVSRAAARS